MSLTRAFEKLSKIQEVTVYHIIFEPAGAYLLEMLPGTMSTFLQGWKRSTEIRDNFAAWHDSE